MKNKIKIYITSPIPENRDNEHRKRLGGLWLYTSIATTGETISTKTWIHAPKYYSGFISEPLIYEMELYSQLYPEGIRIQPKILKTFDNKLAYAIQLELMLKFNYD